MKIVILGAGGRLGSALMREYREKFDVTGFNHAQLDLSDHAQLREKLGTCDIDLVINTAAFANVDLCETQREEAFRINAEAPRVLAEICRDKNAKLIHFSTDYVFDGEKREPYTEDDVAKPISVYGESKWEGEKLVLQTHGPSFIDGMIKRARESDQVDAIADKISTPTYTRDIAQALPQFFDSDVPGGILHFASSGECSWQEYAQWAIDCCHAEGVPLKATTVEPRRMSDMKNWIAPRPVYSVLSTAKYTALTGIAPRSWRDVVGDYVKGSYSKK